MTQRVRIGIVGAGAIGCYVGGKLLAADAADVVLVGRARLRDQLARDGLAVQDFDGARAAVPPSRVTVATAVDAVAACDVVMVAVKSQDTAATAQALAAVVRPDAVVVSLQNGVRNPDVLREALPGRRVLPSIVTWNVIAVDGTYRRATSGPLIVATAPPPLVAALRQAGIPVEERADIAPEQWTKLLVNLSNAVSALSDASTATLLTTTGYRRIMAAVASEGLRVVRAAGVRPARYNGVPLAWMPRILRLPTPLVRVVLRAQLKVDPAARSSMWQDLDARRRTEVDFLNGEIVRLAQHHGVAAPVNARVVELVRAAEVAAAGSPRLSAEALARALGL